MKKNLSFGDMQQVIYAYTIKRMVRSKDFREDILELASISDTFWVCQFDEMYESLTRPHPDIGNMLDNVAFAFEAVSERISDYYGNRWNFPPGYTPIVLPTLDAEVISERSILKLIKQMAPATLAVAMANEKRERAERAQKLKEQAKLYKPQIAGVVAAMFKHSKVAWFDLFRYMKKHKDDDILSFIDGLTDADTAAIRKARSGAQIKRIVKAALTPEQYVETHIYNIREIASNGTITGNFDPLYNKYSRAAVAKELLKHYNAGVDF